MNKIIILGGGSILLGILAGIVTRSLWVGIAFPILLIAFLAMMYAVKGEKVDTKDKEKEKNDDDSRIG
ncbi:MAG: hypothetical protein PHE21_00975 [Candidatus Dojkabacteria bacterium]|nr:hypothetical protein [Candidatus Dojkabacteria bacterium]